MGSKPKMKAGRLLSKFIRQIAEEKTEFLKGEGGEDDRMATKAEAAARLLWRQGMGYEELIVTDDGSKKIIHPPDIKVLALLMDRMEGRAPTAVGDSDDKPSTAQKVTEQGLKRIKAAGRLKDG